MIQKYKFGKPFETEAVVRDIPVRKECRSTETLIWKKDFGLLTKCRKRTWCMGWERRTEASISVVLFT